MKNQHILTEHLRYVLLDGPKYSGTYKFPEALGPHEESLTGEETEAAELFLAWVVANKRTYGWGNLDMLWRDWWVSTFSGRGRSVGRTEP